jgi:hypothetical protein
MRPLWFPLLVLAGVGSGLAASGIEAVWTRTAGAPVSPPVVWAVALALHSGYVAPAILRRGALLGSLAWIAAVHFTALGLAASGFTAPLFRALPLQAAALAAALALRERSTWAERLARWRFARSEIGVQLRMWPGMVPWSVDCVRRLLVGASEAPAHAALQQLADSIEQADSHLHLDVRRMAAPERLRQVLSTAGAALRTDADLAAGRTSNELQQRALAAAAACRDECARLPGLDDHQREALAARCAEVLMEAARVRV